MLNQKNHTMKKFLIVLILFVSGYSAFSQCNADFKESQDPTCVNSPVYFLNISDYGNNYTFLWDFGAGATPATSTAVSPPAVIYSTPGQKQVELRIYDNNGNLCDIRNRNIDVAPEPNVSFTSTAPECTGTGVDFTYTGDTGLDFFWDFGIGAYPATSSVQDPQGIIYDTPGTKTITLTMNNGFCDVTITQTITINETPVADFTSTAPQCTGLAVDFTNTGTTTGVSYSWDFGSGSTPGTSTSQDPAGIVYSTSGSKIISLTTTNTTTGCASSTSQTININQTPSVSFTSTAPVCALDSVDFTNTGTSGSEWVYSWDFGSGSSPANSYTENPTGVVYSNGGDKTVTLTISNGLCSEFVTQTITINETPVADFTSTAPQCTGLAVDFTNTGTTTGVSYSWDFGSGSTPGTSTLQDPAGVVYSTSGSKIITLITTDTVTGCYSASNQTININQTPSVSFTSTTPVCALDSINFTNTGTSGPEWMYTWDFGDDAIPAVSTTENPTGVAYETGGDKQVTLVINDGLCSNEITNTITIYSLPVIDAGLDTTICADRSVQIGTTYDSTFSYSWFPQSTLDDSYAATPVASPIANITNYILTVADSNNCISVDSVVVTMLPPLEADAGIDVEICANDEIQIGAALVEGQSYSWSPAAGLDSTSLPNPIASPDSTTTYILTVTGSGCDAVYDEVTVIVHQLPDANAGEDDTITTGSSAQLIATGGVQYFWTPSYGLDNPGVYHPVASPEETTTYVVEVTDIYGCINTDTMTLTVITPSFWIPNAFTPDNNGRNDILYVRGEGINDFEFKIFNRWGEIIFYSKDMNTGWDGTKQVTGEKLPEGAYVYNIKGVKSDGEPVNVNGIVNLLR